MTEIIFADECYKIMGACFEVYKEQGCGFVESVYQECLSLELSSQNVPFLPQTELKLKYKDVLLKQTFKPDFICFEKIIIEIKAVSTLNDQNRSQVHNYLNAADFRLGLLINFGNYPKLEWERIVH